MKLISTLTVLLLGFSCEAAELSQCAPDSLKQEEATEFLNLLDLGSLEDVDLSVFERARVGSLEHIFFTTGIHCIEPSRSESYHWVQFNVEGTENTYRQIFAVTLEPAASMFESPENLADLFRGKTVTQYYSWAELAENTKGGRVVGYRSRVSVTGCGVEG